MGILGNVKLAQWDGVGEDGSPHSRGHGRGRRWVPAFARTREGEKMGPRIREDTGRGEDGSPPARTHGSPHPRGHGKGRMGPRIREDGKGRRWVPAWVPASARTREGEKMGPRIREDTGRGG